MRLLAPLAVSALLLTACSSGTEAPDASGIEGVETFEDLSTEHVEGAVEYDQSPPVGGEHNQVWLRCEVYDEPVPEEFAVHSMEHGAVWLTYREGLPADQVAALAALRAIDATTTEYVLVSPYEGLDAPVVAVVWGARLAVQDASDPRLREFVTTYAGGGQGGEKGVPCTSAEVALTPEQARAEL